MNIGKEQKMEEVFGNSREVPLTYQVRTGVDNRFVNDLIRGKHVILHGGSKQGKTCLRKSYLKEYEYIVIQCTRDTSKASLYEMILKKAEIEYEKSSSKTIKGTNKFSVKVQGEAKIPFITNVSGEGNYERQNESGSTQNFKTLEIDVEDANDIVRVLKANSFNKFIVIEDFHYLDEQIQKQFSFDLKVFYETSKYVFIIVGVWMESNRLIIYNGDLTGRITNINVDKWTDDNLKMVINNGKPLLNIEFPIEVEEEIIKLSQDNVGLLQEICYRICEKADVWKTQETQKFVGTLEEVRQIAKNIADDQAARYKTFIIKFSEGLTVTELAMYKWIIYAIINSTSDELRNGLSHSKIYSIIKLKHPKNGTLQLNNLTSALDRVQAVQAKQKLQPLILDYSNSELFVVDANFLVFLSTHTKEELLEPINII